MAKRMLKWSGVAYELKRVTPLQRLGVNYVVLTVRPWNMTGDWQSLELPEIEYRAADQRFVKNSAGESKDVVHVQHDRKHQTERRHPRRTATKPRGP